ncbi:MAG TPA: YdeI/OmpD-associated family protein [Candidatus Dormibacteraeota bacterium]
MIEIRPAGRADWRAWLVAHHDHSPGVWLIWRKKGSSASGITLEEALEEALCFGWIDSTLNPINSQLSRLKFTPRRPKSIWSRQNKRRVASLIRHGLMTDAGLRVIRAAKSDGSWHALDAVEALVVPDDLAKALAANPGAKQTFDGLSASAQKSILWSIESAKRSATRSRRIGEAIRRITEQSDRGPSR